MEFYESNALKAGKKGARESTVTDADGRPWSLNSENFLASNGTIQNKLARMLK